MSFWDFLNWLFSQIQRVLAWFGSYWNYAIYIIYSIVNTVITYANNAFTNAINWARGQIDTAYNNALYFISVLRRDATAWVESAKNYVLGILNNATTAINNTINWIKNQINSFYTWVTGEITTAISNVRTFLEGVIKVTSEGITKIFSPLLVLVDKIPSILTLLSQDIYTKVMQMVQGLFSMINLFFSNPVSFIYGVLWSTFIDFLSFVVAYALGTETASLPPRPDWGNPDTGVPVTPPPPVTPGSGQITKPVNPLYISGYTFGGTHKGTDFGLTMGQTIYAAHDGEVTYAAWDTTGYGNRIDISGNPYWSRYGHLQGFYVKTGQKVTAGQAIAPGDSTGNSTGPHLHFELRYNGTYVNPMSYL